MCRAYDADCAFCLDRLEEVARKQREREAELEEKKRQEREAIIAGTARPSPAPSPEKPSEAAGGGGGGYVPPTRRGGSGMAPHPWEPHASMTVQFCLCTCISALFEAQYWCIALSLSQHMTSASVSTFHYDISDWTAAVLICPSHTLPHGMLFSYALAEGLFHCRICASYTTDARAHACCPCGCCSISV